ncbi:hypothetical protein ACLOAU_22315 [Niabella sp. CJ426]|jgi:hypothetical protein|uniref:hypothetical protein n=1 Tax=Niabella sp. CJ426 TaxID=3393740 RepID=UPI003D00B414
MTVETNKSQAFLASVKNIAIALVGAGIAGKGLTYFTPHLSYDVPRILLPVYKAFGPTGLAVSMVVLGALLAGWSFFRWISSSRKPVQWILIVGVLALLIIGGVYAMDAGRSKEASTASLLQEPPASANAVAIAAGTVVFPSSFSRESKQQYDQLIKNLEAAIQEKDPSKSWTTYNELNIFTAGLKADQNDPEQLQFIIAQSRRMDDYNNQIKSFAGSR